ncbi:MAG: trimeric intracellular cation channel family protein [Bacteroidetes bacterium]|nr:trimeric intracellular cation channel family protein [Bacteroidota bacterium]
MTTQYILEIFGTGFFAISGALAATDKSKPDWFGVTFIGFITSIGGGSVRDLLLGSYPLGWVKDVNFVYSIIAGIVIASLFFKTLIKLRRTFFLFDTLGIAMFTILGTEKALAHNIHPLVAAIMGMFSAVMGGVLRDVLTNEIPVIFKKEVYATACFAGALFYILIDSFSDSRNLNIISGMLLIFIIRILAIKYNLSLPKFRKDEEVNSP